MSSPVYAKFYPVPLHLPECFDKEVDLLLKLCIIQPSTSPHSSPVVMLSRADGNNRMTIYFGTLNSVTNFLTEPPCVVEKDLRQFATAKYFTELYLSRAYNQVKLNVEGPIRLYLNRFKYNLIGPHFVLEIDHKPLVYLNKFKGKNSRLLRWALSGA